MNRADINNLSTLLINTNKIQTRSNEIQLKHLFIRSYKWLNVDDKKWKKEHLKYRTILKISNLNSLQIKSLFSVLQENRNVFHKNGLRISMQQWSKTTQNANKHMKSCYRSVYFFKYRRFFYLNLHTYLNVNSNTPYSIIWKSKWGFLLLICN